MRFENGSKLGFSRLFLAISTPHPVPLSVSDGAHGILCLSILKLGAFLQAVSGSRLWDAALVFEAFFTIAASL